MRGDNLKNAILVLWIFRLLEPSAEVQVVPADDGVLDQAVAAFGDLLCDFLALFEAAWIADGDGTGETVREFDLVELLLDGLAQFHLVDVAQA